MKWSWWGTDLPYGPTRERQLRLRESIQRGEAEECLALLEHAAVVTTGRRKDSSVPDPELLRAAGVDFARSERGGLSTYHGPGQLVAYALVDVRKRQIKVRCFVHALEEACIRFLATHEVEAGRADGAPGVWVGGQKIAAVGVHFSKGVSMHGLALNLAPNLKHYELIQPCGFDSGAVTSLYAWRQVQLEAREVAPEFAGILRKCIEEAACP